MIYLFVIFQFVSLGRFPFYYHMFRFDNLGLKLQHLCRQKRKKKRKENQVGHDLVKQKSHNNNFPIEAHLLWQISLHIFN